MYTHILVPLDGSELAEQVLPHVKTLAGVGTKPRITLLKAVPREYPDIVEGETTNKVVDPMRKLTAEAQIYLGRVAEALRDEGHTVDTEISVKFPADAIIDYAAHHDVDLIAIATHGRGGLGRWMFGSVTQKVMQATPAPMLVVRPRE